MSLKLKFLGTGTSVGVPQIGCRCEVCTSTDPRDKRRRSGVYLFAGNTAVVVDTPPEFREACLEYRISKVDAVVLTHPHMDHVAGFDDIRRFNTLNGGTSIPCYASPQTVEAMHRIFPYIGNRPNCNGLFRPMIDFIAAERRFAVGELSFTPFPVMHGDMPANGYLIESGPKKIGYVPDCHVLPDEAVALLRGADVMVLNCLRERPHPTHLNLEAALAYMRRIAPKRGYFIHMCHDVKHAVFEARLPEPLKLAYDGLEVEV